MGYAAMTHDQVTSTMDAERRRKLPVPRRIRNNLIARKMAIRAGLVIPPGVDPAWPEGIGLPLHDYRTSMLRIYRRHKREKLTASKRVSRRAAQPQVQQRQSMWDRTRRWVRKILPTRARR